MDMGKLNSNKSPPYKDVLIAAAIFLQAEMLRYFYFILAFSGAVLARDTNFCIGWGCFFLPPPAWLQLYFVGAQASPLPPPLALSHPQLQEWMKHPIFGALGFLLMVCEVEVPAEAGLCQCSDSTSEPAPSGSNLVLPQSGNGQGVSSQEHTLQRARPSSDCHGTGDGCCSLCFLKACGSFLTYKVAS